MRKYLTPLWGGALFVFIAGGLSPSNAGEFSPSMQVIEEPGQTLSVESGGATAVVFFEDHGEFYDLTMLMQDAGEDEVLRARVQLADGQGHAMILNSSDGRDRFIFRRSGTQILVIGTVLGQRRAGL